ncbi:hypothetical protein D3C79_910900 [compost metagenome]
MVNSSSLWKLEPNKSKKLEPIPEEIIAEPITAKRPSLILHLFFRSAAIKCLSFPILQSISKFVISTIFRCSIVIQFYPFKYIKFY